MAATRKSDHPAGSIEALVQEHRRRVEEPLHLALQLQDLRHPKDVVLMEVIGGFGGGHIDPDRRFMEVTMSSSSVVLPPGGRLRLIFTSPEELEAASKKNWLALRRVKRLQLVKVHRADKVGRSLQALLLPSQ